MRIAELLPLTSNKAALLFEIYASGQAYLRELARSLKKSPSLCATVLNSLRASGVIEKSKSGRNMYYSLRDSYEMRRFIIPILDEFYLEKMASRSEKLRTLTGLIRSNAALTTTCSAIYIFGSYARGSFDEKESDIDVLFVTSGKTLVAKFIREASVMINKEINGIVLGEGDFVKATDGFVSSIRDNPKERLVVWKR